MSPNTDKKKILVVDDEEALVEALTARLQMEGYQVLSAFTGEKGLQTAQVEKPDLIILDIFLPGEDGLAILKKLKRPVDSKTGESSKTRQIPVLVLTGRGQQMKDMFEMEEAAAFLTKPFETQSLLSAIQKILR